MTSTSIFFDVVLCFVSLKFSYWCKFHVNIITGSGIMTIFFYKGLTRNPEIGNVHVWVFPNIWRLGRVIDTMNVSNRMLLNAKKIAGLQLLPFLSYYRKNQLGRGELPPTQIRVNTILLHKGLTRNPEIGNTHVWVFPNIWRLARVMDTINVSNRMLLNATKLQGCSFYRFWFIEGKPTAGGGGLRPLHPD